MLITKKLKIGQTKSWDDTYENFLVNSEIKMGVATVSLKCMLNDFYGQCWTLSKESDALWRIYSHDKQGVQIKSTVQKLIDVANYGNELFPNESRLNVIGKVDYKTDTEINQWISLQDLHGTSLRESLFIKRPEFKHEEEVRLIMHKYKKPKDNEFNVDHPFIEIDFNPMATIDKITFDPRLKNEDFESAKFILKRLGFKKRIERSSLYRFNPFKKTL
jgi:hypothetical protein